MSAPTFAPAAPGSLGVLAIRAPNWVGDVVMATPVLRAAVRDPRFRAVHILVRRHLADVLCDGPLEPHLEPIADDAEETERYRQLGADRVLLLSNSLGAAWRAFRARVPVRAGAALSRRGPLLTHTLVPPTDGGRRVPIPTAHLHADVAGLLGIRPLDLEPRLDVAPSTADRARAALVAAGLPAGQRYALVAPGAAFGAAKLWPAERFAQAARALCDPRGLGIVVVGAPAESALVARVAGQIGPDARVPDTAEGGLAVLRGLVAGARLLLVGDSGPRWLAAAFGVPCVSVMGPNFPELTQTALERAEVVRIEGLECSPCLERRCPLGHHRCLAALPVGAVVRAGERVLARAALLP